MENPDLNRIDLEQAERGIALMKTLLGQVPTFSAEAQGCDATGTVTVSIGRDGLPDTIAIGEDWRREVGAEGLAAAVDEAFRHAAEAGSTRGLDELGESRWLDNFAAAIAYANGDGPAPVIEPAPPYSGRIPETLDLPESLPTLEDFDFDLDLGAGVEQWAASASASASASAAGSGSAAGGRVTITISALGQVSCSLDPDWLGRQDTDVVQPALATALAEARTEWTRVDPIAALRRVVGGLA